MVEVTTKRTDFVIDNNEIYYILQEGLRTEVNRRLSFCRLRVCLIHDFGKWGLPASCLTKTKELGLVLGSDVFPQR